MLENDLTWGRFVAVLVMQLGCVLFAFCLLDWFEERNKGGRSKDEKRGRS